MPGTATPSAARFVLHVIEKPDTRKVMSRKVVSFGVAIIVAVLVGCQKKAEAVKPVAEAPKPVTVEVVKESERSHSFVAVNQHLELGGTLYGYVDVDGDVLKIVGGLHEVFGQMAKMQPGMAMVANQDFGAIATKLGLTDVKAIGLSSVRDDSGFFRNRAFFYTPGERHGLLLGLGGKPGPLAHVNLAPADTAFYSEADLDLPVVYRTIKDVVSQVAGEPVGNQLEEAIKKAGDNISLSVLDLIYGLKGRSAAVVRIDPERTMRTPGPQGIAIPAFSLLLCVDGVGPVVEPALAKSPAFKRTDEGTLHVFQLAQALPIEGVQPVIVIDGTTLYFATTRAFLDECRSGKPGLAQSAEFQKASAAMGTDNNGLTYVHPRVFDAIRKITALNPNLPPQVQSMMAMVVGKLPKIDRPMVAVRTNLPDGILVRAYWDRSLKQDVAMIAVYNPVSIGLMAAMAIPAFQKVRASSQEKAVLNNLRQLSSAADQYYLEHGTDSVTYNELVGPGKYIKQMQSVAGEDYHQILFMQGRPLRVRLPDGRVIHYP